MTWNHGHPFALPLSLSKLCPREYMVLDNSGAAPPPTSQPISHVVELTLSLRKCLVRHLEGVPWRGVASPKDIGIHHLGVFEPSNWI